MRQANRITPNLSVQSYKTYSITAPPSTHFRPATCKEVDCPAYMHGWRTVVDERTYLGATQAGYIRREAGRSFTEAKEEGGLTVFTFAPEQVCFQPHQVRLERAEIFSTRGGDWRGATTSSTIYRPEHWVENFQENQEALKRKLGEG